MSGLFNTQRTIRRSLRKQPVCLSLGLAAPVFLADLLTPLGVASGVPYSLAIVLALNASTRRYVVAFAVLCSILTVSALFLGPGRGGSELWKVLTNRFLALFRITLTLGMTRRRSEQRRREAEEQTRLHLADLAHMSRLHTAGQLATTLAHELNQPLAAISFQSEIAAKLVHNNGQANPRLSKATHEVTEQSLRAAGIIRSLRYLVRKSEPRQSPVQLNDLVRDVTRLIDPHVQRGKVDLD